MPLVSRSSALAALIYSANLEGLINLSYSCVPLGSILKIYSAPTIAVTHDLGFLFIVDRNKFPPGFSSLVQTSINDFGSGTCSKTSRHDTTSNLSSFFL